MKISKLKFYEKNPRKISKNQLDNLSKSIKDFEKMLTIRKIVIDENNVIIGGNQRVKALQQLGYTKIPDEWIDKRTDLTEEEKKEFLIKDNSPQGISGEWDLDLLSEWDFDKIEDWGVDLTIYNQDEFNEKKEDFGDYNDLVNKNSIAKNAVSDIEIQGKLKEKKNTFSFLV